MNNNISTFPSSSRHVLLMRQYHGKIDEAREIWCWLSTQHGLLRPVPGEACLAPDMRINLLGVVWERTESHLTPYAIHGFLKLQLQMQSFVVAYSYLL